MNKYLKQYKWSNIWAMMRNGWRRPNVCPDDFKGKFVVITGATSGIGYVTAKEYASHGANLLCINRNEEKSKVLCEEIITDYGVECNYIIADFSHIEEVHNVAQELLKIDHNIDVIIHNAGVYSTKKIFTDDGLELVFQVNYLGSFILNFLLKEKLKAQHKTRILFVNSEGHRFAISGIHLDDLEWDKHRYTGLRSYGAAKVAQLLSMIKFSKFFEDSNVTINAMHPGNVRSSMGNNNGRVYRLFKLIFVNLLSKSPKRSAKALYFLGVSKNVEYEKCKFFNLTTEEIPAPPALDQERAEELWKLSIQLGRLE